jgi:hypothetical protein
MATFAVAMGFSGRMATRQRVAMPPKVGAAGAATRRAPFPYPFRAGGPRSIARSYASPS